MRERERESLSHPRTQQGAPPTRSKVRTEERERERGFPGSRESFMADLLVVDV